MGNLLLKGFADQWITLVTAIPQSCPSVADSLRRLLTLFATKQLAVQCLLKHERRIAVLTGNWAYLIVLVNVIVPWTIAIFVTIRIPALRVVHITHNISPGRMLCKSQFAEVVAEIFGKIQYSANFLLSYFCKNLRPTSLYAFIYIVLMHRN